MIIITHKNVLWFKFNHTERRPGFDASEWAVVDIPHDASVTGGYASAENAAGLEVLYEQPDFQRYQSGQPTEFSGALAAHTS